MFRQLRPAITSVLATMVLLGVVFPLALTVVARLAFPRQAAGSLIERDGKVVGSALIGQSFTTARYFHPRPSAAGAGYDASASGGTNLGPTSDKLIHGIHRKLPNGQDDPGNFDGIADLAAAYRSENGLGVDAPVPADAVTRSASGLDPDISPMNAALQAARVARARGLPIEVVHHLIAAHTQARQLGFLGERRVNALLLNLALDNLAPRAGAAPSRL